MARRINEIHLRWHQPWVQLWMKICWQLVYIYIYIYYIHTCMHACMHAYMHTYMHACMHAYIHTHIHTYIYIYCIYGYNWINWITAGLMWYNMVYIRMYNCIITYNVCNKNMDLLPEQKWLHIRSPQWLTSSVPSKARLGGFKLQDWTTK